MATTKVQSSKSPTDLGQLLYIRKKQKQKMNQSGAEERCRKRKYLIHSTEKSKINGVPRVIRSTASMTSSSMSITAQLTPCQSHSSDENVSQPDVHALGYIATTHFQARQWASGRCTLKGRTQLHLPQCWEDCKIPMARNHCWNAHSKNRPLRIVEAIWLGPEDVELPTRTGPH